MKRLFAFCLILALCLTVAGCRSAGLLPSQAGTAPGTTPGTTPGTESEETTGDVTSPQLPEEGDEIVGTSVNFSNVQTLRITYSGAKSNVVYVTSPAQLPKHEAFSAYDAAFFRDRALVLVTDTVGSGSVRVGIDRITVSGNTAYVTVSRELPGDVGTGDMATWYIWAEVEAGLTCRWEVFNPGYRNPWNDRVSRW